jgi:hypothetical protein
MLVPLLLAILSLRARQRMVRPLLTFAMAAAATCAARPERRSACAAVRFLRTEQRGSVPVAQR